MPSERQLRTVFGPLEVKVLKLLWQRASPSTVGDLLPDFPATAYTTLMTTMDRLFQKGVLSRRKQGRAFFYTPNLSEADQVAKIASECFAALLPNTDPVYSVVVLEQFVSAAGRQDELLDELERLLAERRAALRAKQEHG